MTTWLIVFYYLCVLRHPMEIRLWATVAKSVLFSLSPRDVLIFSVKNKVRHPVLFIVTRTEWDELLYQKTTLVRSFVLVLKTRWEWYALFWKLTQGDAFVLWPKIISNKVKNLKKNKRVEGHVLQSLNAEVESGISIGWSVSPAHRQPQEEKLSPRGVFKFVKHSAGTQQILHGAHSNKHLPGQGTERFF